MFAWSSELVVGALVLSDLLLATVTFAVIARPELALGTAVWLVGGDDGPTQGWLSEEQEAVMLALIGRLSWPLLAGLFGWSFVCGSLLGVLS